MLKKHLTGGRPRRRWQEEGLSGVRGLAGAPHYQGYGVAGLSPGGPSAAPPTRRRAVTRGRAAGRAPAASGLRQAGGGGPWPGCAPLSAPGASQQRQTDPAPPASLLKPPVFKVYINGFILRKLGFVFGVLFVGFVRVNITPLYSFSLTAL